VTAAENVAQRAENWASESRVASGHDKKRLSGKAVMSSTIGCKVGMKRIAG